MLKEHGWDDNLLLFDAFLLFITGDTKLERGIQKRNCVLVVNHVVGLNVEPRAQYMQRRRVSVDLMRPSH